MLFAKYLKKICQIWPRRLLKHFTAAYRGFPPCTQSQPPINRETGYSNVLPLYRPDIQNPQEDKFASKDFPPCIITFALLFETSKFQGQIYKATQEDQALFNISICGICQRGFEDKVLNKINCCKGITLVPPQISFHIRHIIIGVMSSLLQSL